MSDDVEHKGWDHYAQLALDRMNRAHRRGTGCHLTAEMIASLHLSFLGEVWADQRPQISKGTPNDRV